MFVSSTGEGRGFHAPVRHLRTLSDKLCRSLVRRVTYCRKTGGATVLRIALAMVARYLTDQHLLPALALFRVQEARTSIQRYGAAHDVLQVKPFSRRGLSGFAKRRLFNLQLNKRSGRK